MANNFRINLLSKKERLFVSEAFLFLNTYAKYIIIITQLLVLAVFLAKIVLDQSVIDLKEAVDQKNYIILSAEEMIQNNNHFADKLEDIAKIIEANDRLHKIITTTLNNIPKTITLDKIEFTGKMFVMLGHTSDPLDIQKMQLRISKKTKLETKISSIGKEFNIYHFELTIENEKTT